MTSPSLKESGKIPVHVILLNTALTTAHPSSGRRQMKLIKTPDAPGAVQIFIFCALSRQSVVENRSSDTTFLILFKVITYGLH